MQINNASINKRNADTVQSSERLLALSAQSNIEWFNYSHCERGFSKHYKPLVIAFESSFL